MVKGADTLEQTISNLLGVLCDNSCLVLGVLIARVYYVWNKNEFSNVIGLKNVI